MQPEGPEQLEGGAFLTLLGGLLLLAFLAEEAFEWLRLPPVLALIAAGLILGPAFGLLPATRFARVAPEFGALAFLLILFEGGLDLDLREVVTRLRAGTALAIANFAVSFCIAASVGLAGDLGLRRAVALGIVLAPVSGAIVMPLVGKLGLGAEARTTVVLEAAFADVLGVLGMALLARIVTGGGLFGLVALGSVLAAVSSALAGVGVGLIWPRALRWLGERRFVDVVTFAVALSLWGVADLFHASGPLAILAFGVTLANEGPLLRLLGASGEPVSGTARHAVRRLHRFIGELTFLVRTFFFVFLGVVVRFAHLPARRYLEAAAVLVLFLAGRALTLRALGARKVLTPTSRELRTMWVLQPRGLVSAVLALAAANLGLDDDGTLLGVTSVVILATNALLLTAGMGIRRSPSQVSESGSRP